MILYHGSYIPIEKPDLTYSRDKVDFGKGFYTTPLHEQAVNFAERFLTEKGTAVVSLYEISDSFSEKINILSFDSHSNEWIDFIDSCRSGVKTSDEWDLIIGGVANDKVVNILGLLHEKLISRKEAIKRLKYNKPNFQYCFKNQKTIDKYLKYKGKELIT